MINFLMTTISKLKTNNFNNLTIIYGNESCDLDSVVCSLVYASFLHWQYEQMKCKVCTRVRRVDEEYKDNIYVPILNTERESFNLKTEVKLCLNECGVNPDKLVFRDDIDLEALVSAKNANVVLVDHHVLAQKDEFLTNNVTEIIDHRPLDRGVWKYKDDTRSTIETVGSCATLVCSRIRDLAKYVGDAELYFQNYPGCADLLHSTIILDTVNFSKQVNKATPLDEQIVLYLESITKPHNVETCRKDKLEKLIEARKDVSTLNAGQLLKKDVKIVGRVLAPSFPILVKEFLQRPNVESAMSECLLYNHCFMLVLLGMQLDGNKVSRDLAIYSLQRHEQNATMLSTMCQEWPNPQLKLEAQECPIQYCKYFKQENISASRKQVVQIINEFLKKFKLE